MDKVKNLVFGITILIAGINGVLHAMENQAEKLKTKRAAFSNHLRTYNVENYTIEEFDNPPYNNFEDSTPYVYCQPPYISRFFNFIHKALLGSSVKELNDALRARRLRKYNSNPIFLSDIIRKTPFLENKISDEMRQKQLRIPQNATITLQEKDLYTENDDLKRDYPDKVSFTI